MTYLKLVEEKARGLGISAKEYAEELGHTHGSLAFELERAHEGASARSILAPYDLEWSLGEGKPVEFIALTEWEGGTRYVFDMGMRGVRGNPKHKADVRVSWFASVLVRALEDLEQLEDKLAAAQEKGLPMMVRFYQARIAEQEQVIAGAEALYDVGDMPDDEDLDTAQNPYDELQELIVYANNPVGPKVTGYEGMEVKYTPHKPKWRGVVFDEANAVERFAHENGLIDDIRERAYAIYLDQRNKPLGYRLISSGGVAEAVVDPKVIFGPAVTLHAAGLILVHNHPSGDYSPSSADESITQRVKEAGALLGIRLVDHVIVGPKEGHYSFQAEGNVL